VSDANFARISGTREWSVESDNVVLGCTHKCRYCYARANAVRRRQIGSYEEWGESYNRVRPAQLRRRRKPVNGRVMFPTTHDITPEHLAPCLEVIRKHLRAGNELLIVSKPHLECVQAICLEARMFHELILFRFTVGAMEESILAYWEPGAPTFEERLACLRYAHRQGYATSVSCEPLLDADNAVNLFRTVEPYVSDTIWIGKMNQLRSRCIPGTSETELRRIEAGQTDEAVQRIYAALRDEPKVRWKESYKKVLGLDLAEVAGMDV